LPPPRLGGTQATGQGDELKLGALALTPLEEISNPHSAKRGKQLPQKPIGAIDQNADVNLVEAGDSSLDRILEKQHASKGEGQGRDAGGGKQAE